MESEKLITPFQSFFDLGLIPNELIFAQSPLVGDFVFYFFHQFEIVFPDTPCRSPICDLGIKYIRISISSFDACYLISWRPLQVFCLIFKILI